MGQKLSSVGKIVVLPEMARVEGLSYLVYSTDQILLYACVLYKSEKKTITSKELIDCVVFNSLPHYAAF